MTAETRAKISRTTKGRPQPWRRKADRKVRSSRAEARRSIAPTICAWRHLGSCSGNVQCAHMDQNPFNNARGNLMALCASHHHLYDLGLIDPQHPTMPAFYIDAGGKRRYAHTLKRQYRLRQQREAS